MDSIVDSKIECSDCGEALPQEWIGSKERGSCHNCGSNLKTISLNITEEVGVDIKDALTGKVKDLNYNSKKNPRYEFFEGHDVRRSDGKWMKKSRVLDKYNDKYLEVVIDPDTDEIVHYCEEPLSKHFDHGSAKFNKK